MKKKLRLHRETLRKLDRGLGAVGGGFSYTDTQPTYTDESNCCNPQSQPTSGTITLSGGGTCSAWPNCIPRTY